MTFPVFDYICYECGTEKDSSNMESFVCECGGQMRLRNSIGLIGTTVGFDPHFCPTLKQHVNSWADQEKKAKAFRSADHPEGFTLLQANKPYMNHLKKVYKNREDVKASQYAKDGIKYPKGKQVYFDEPNGRFVNKFSKEPIDSKRYSVPSKPLRVSEKVKLKAVAMILGFMLIASTGFCKIDGVHYVEIKVKGVSYEVPIYKPDFTELNAKLILDALDGDKNARKIVLQGKTQRTLFIGDGDHIRWLHITENDEWVTDVPKD